MKIPYHLKKIIDWWTNKGYVKVKIFPKNRYKDDAVYNHADNLVMVKSLGNFIFVICHKEEQMQQVISRMTTDNCVFNEYEEWDEGEDKRWIITFRIIEEDEEPAYN
tara:strand:- start:345 stop:665 length:321 start_codon:yes stop_codon:yes gene_type:complete